MSDEEGLLLPAFCWKKGAFLFRVKKAVFFRSWLDDGDRAWRANQLVKIERERSQLRYELALRTRRANLRDQETFDSTMEGMDGVVQFEANMKRLGIGNEVR